MKQKEKRKEEIQKEAQNCGKHSHKSKTLNKEML